MQNMFLKIGDKDNPITGECSSSMGKNLLGKAGHEKWIEVLSFREKAIQPASPLVSSSQGRTVERTHLEDFQITKYIDVATPMIHQRCCEGSHIDKVILELYRADAYGAESEPVLYMAYILKDCIISSHEVTAQGADLPIEVVTFKFGLIYTRYIPQSPKSGAYTASPVGGGWDLVLNAPASAMP